MTDAIEAMRYLRETDTLRTKTIERAVVQDLRVERVDDHTYRVTNNDHDDPSNHRYEVDVADTIVANCECPAFTHRNEVCKHMVAVALSFGSQESGGE